MPAGVGAGGVGAGGMALNDSAVALEINHVRRQLLGRAFHERTTVKGVVLEHQVYREGIKRALDGAHAAWQLDLLHTRDVVRERGVSRSVWRPATAGPGNRSHAQQANVNAYAGPKGSAGLGGVPRRRKREYTPMSKEQLEEWVKKVDHLQRKVSAT